MFVDVFAVCAFAVTFVVNENQASDVSSMPTPASVGVQPMLMSVRAHAVSGELQLIVVRPVSIFTVAVRLMSVGPATSCAEPVNTEVPFALIGTDVLVVPSGERSSAGDEGVVDRRRADRRRARCAKVIEEMPELFMPSFPVTRPRRVRRTAVSRAVGR